MSFKQDSIFQTLKTHINYLASVSELELTKISENKKIKLSYNIVLDYLLKSKDDKKIRKYIKKIISNLYQPTEIIPNTIGSFIFGCNMNDYGDIDKFCSILCLDSWKCTHKIKCNQNVIVQVTSQGEDRFIFKNETDSEKCFVYIKDKFNGFYDHELEKLYNHKIKYVQIMTTEKSKHFKINEFVLLSSIPKLTIVKSNTDIIDNLSDDSGLILIFCAILIIIIIFLFVFRHRFV